MPRPGVAIRAESITAACAELAANAKRRWHKPGLRITLSMIVIAD